MRRVYFILLFGFIGVWGCSFNVSPILQTATFAAAPVSRSDVTDAAVKVLQEKGYTISLVNERMGTVTTDWYDYSGVMNFILYDTPPRRRIMVSVTSDPTTSNAQSISVQLSRQEWSRNKYIYASPLSEDKKEVQEILQKISQTLGVGLAPSAQ